MKGNAILNIVKRDESDACPLLRSSSTHQASRARQLPTAPQPRSTGCPQLTPRDRRRPPKFGDLLRLGRVALPRRRALTRPSQPEREVARERGPALGKLPHSRPAAPGPAVRADVRAPRPQPGRPQTPRGPRRTPPTARRGGPRAPGGRGA